ncbi:hypothetical protein L6164_023272 [Bauhinia variegata]|uniref:Uncharacterized protein n=1 Tax=Bauhinia variegata TaxID=167791 RepID=A0ACB9MIM5_BAUVA|nr:hypothetical protein L6164_023272 [Bauhinia variegata]
MLDLQSKAKEMVMLAEKMRQKLLSGSNSQMNAGDQEMGSKEEMQDWLLSVGIISPVTKESAGALYHQQLSRQLADFVKIPLERAGGIINLIDVYCLFNRARGTADHFSFLSGRIDLSLMICCKHVLSGRSLMCMYDAIFHLLMLCPVVLRKFHSEVMVIQNKSHSDEQVFAKLKILATKPDGLRAGISASDAAMTLGVAPAMALSAKVYYAGILKDHGVYASWVKAIHVPGVTSSHFSGSVSETSRTLQVLQEFLEL